MLRNARYRIAIFGCFLLFYATSGMAQQLAKEESRLRARVEAFFKDLSDKDYKSASRYILPEMRDAFLHQMLKPQFSKWRIEKLTFNKQHSECEAAILIATRFPQNPTMIDWRLIHLWVKEKKKWYFKPVQNDNPVEALFGKHDAAPSVPSKSQPQ
jgi:hypothetical protein